MSESSDKYVKTTRRMSDAELIAILDAIMDSKNLTPLEEAVIDEIDRRDL